MPDLSDGHPAQDVLNHLGSRWVPIVSTSNSGKQQFVCICCGRLSTTPDKFCTTGAMIVTGEKVPPKKYVRCEEWALRSLRS